MASSKDCNQQTFEQVEFNGQHEEQNRASSSNSILSKQREQLIVSATSNQATFETIDSNQLKKAELTSRNSKLIGSLGSNNQNALNGITNGTKITGKLVAVRKDGNSYTFTTSTTSSNSSAKTTFTIATPPSKGTALITVSKPHLTTKAIANNSTLIATTRTPHQRLYYNKATNRIEQENSIALNQSTAIQGDLLQQNNSGKINASKPIILQMKRKIQVLNDETRKTARIFTIPSSSSANLINKPTNLSNQFIVMNRPLLKPNLMTNSCSEAAGSSLTKTKTTSIDAAAKPTVASLSSNENNSTHRIKQTIVKLKTKDLIASGASETAAITIIPKQISNDLANLIENKMDTKLDSRSNIKPKLDTKMSSTESEMPKKLTTPNATDDVFTIVVEQSSDVQSATEQVQREKLLGNKNKTSENLCFKSLNAEETIKISPAIESFSVFESGPEAAARTTRRTTIESIIESTIENSFQNSTTTNKSTSLADTCASEALATEHTTDCIEIEQDIEQDIEFNPNSGSRDEDCSVSLGSSQSLINSNGISDCSSAALFNMQTNSKPDSLEDNLIMDECTAALVLMSLSFSPKNNHYNGVASTATNNNPNLHSPSLISQKVVFQCTWRCCGKESESREQIEQHVRQQHLGISSPNGDHEEDFYYTEIDVSTQDSSGVSSADSPDQSPTSCCGEQIEFCACNSKIKQEKRFDEFVDGEACYGSKSIRTKKLKDSIRLDRLNKQQRTKKSHNNVSGKIKKNKSLVWTKKGLLKCNGSTFEMKRVGRPRRMKINSQPTLSKNGTVGKCPNGVKEGQTLMRCGLARRSASSPINIPGISIAHQTYLNSNHYNNSSNQDPLDGSYNSDQFKVGSIRSNVGLLEQCMGKQQLYSQQRRLEHHAYDFISSLSTSTSSSGVPASIDSSVLSINSSLTSSSSTTSSSPSSPSLLSNFSTADQDDWPFSSGFNCSAGIADKHLQRQQNSREDDDYLDAKYRSDLCNGNSLFTAHNHSIKKSSTSNLLDEAKHHSKEHQQENTLQFMPRSVRQTVTIVKNNPQANSYKQSQKSVGYYASLHRGIIQPPNQQNFIYADRANSLQSSNHQTAQASSNAKSISKHQTARRSRSGNGGKCRNKYGMENKTLWCLQCRWKKACSRVDSKEPINDLQASTMLENELSSSPTLVQT